MQPSFTASGDGRHEVATKMSATYTVEILRDDICWLANRIRQLQAINAARERKLAGCYRRLLRQRQQQLASGSRLNGICRGSWNDYFD